MALRPRSIGVLLLLAACAGEEPRPAAPPAEEPPVAAGARESAFVQRDVCPFECCVYGEWKALAPVPVHAAAGDTSRIAFELAARERFGAVTGEVHLDPVGRVLVLDTVALPSPEGEGAALLPGDTVELLAPVGEGFHHVRAGGRVAQSPAFWEEVPPDGARPAGELLRAPEWSWWVRVRGADGREGWLDMTAHGDAVWGADACGGPEPA